MSVYQCSAASSVLRHWFPAGAPAFQYEKGEWRNPRRTPSTPLHRRTPCAPRWSSGLDGPQTSVMETVMGCKSRQRGRKTHSFLRAFLELKGYLSLDSNSGLWNKTNTIFLTMMCRFNSSVRLSFCSSVATSLFPFPLIHYFYKLQNRKPKGVRTDATKTGRRKRVEGEKTLLTW